MLEGTGKVYLAGNVVPEDEEDFGHDFGSDEEEGSDADVDGMCFTLICDMCVFVCVSAVCTE